MSDTPTLDGLVALFDSMPKMPPDVRWMFRQSDFVPKGTFYVADLAHNDTEIGRFGPRYLIVAREELTHAEQLDALACYFKKREESAARVSPSALPSPEP